MPFKTIQEIDEVGDRLTNEHRINLQTPRAKWTGWKYCGYDVMAVPAEMVRNWEDGFVSQMVWYKAKDQRVEYGYYVNLPGMQHGKFDPRGPIDIGFERLMPDTLPENIDTMLERGWEALIALVKEAEGVDISDLRIEAKAA